MHSFLWLSSIPLYICTSFFIHLSVDGHLGCFHVLAIIKRAAMNIGVHVSSSILVSSGYMPRSGISVPCGGFIPSFLRNLHIHLLFMHTQILVLNYMHSYFITVYRVRNSNWSWCLSAALDDNKIPWAFLSLEAKEGEIHLHSKITSPLRFYVAFNCPQLLGS